MKKNVAIPLTVMMITGFTMLSCKKEKEEEQLSKDYTHGVFIINEGAFGKNDGSVSYYNPSDKTAVRDLFFEANGRTAGDVVQSFAVAGSSGYLVVNNSKKVEVVEMKTFKTITVIGNLSYPLYFLPVSETKAYLSNGNMAPGQVYVVNLTSHVITDTIPVGAGPENIILSGDYAYVANGGGYSCDSTVDVINIQSDTLVSHIIVGDNPREMVVDNNGNVHVYCSGKVIYDNNWNPVGKTKALLATIDQITHAVTQSLILGDAVEYPNVARLAINGDKTKLFYTFPGGVYSMNVQDNIPPAAPVINIHKIYGMDIDTVSNTVYCLRCPSFSAAGYMIRYKMDGTLMDSVQVGIGPKAACFN